MEPVAQRDVIVRELMHIVDATYGVGRPYENELRFLLCRNDFMQAGPAADAPYHQVVFHAVRAHGRPPPYQVLVGSL